MTLYKHHTGLIVAIPESYNQYVAFLALAQMNNYLDQKGMATSD
jgi:hypothetical protein